MSDARAILIESDGEISTPHFDGFADGDHPGGPLWYVRGLIDSAAPEGVAIPNSDELVVLTDGHAHYHRRPANVIGSAVVADAFELPLQVVCGAVLITGGSADEPRALTATQLAETLDFLGLEPVSTSVEG
jgi:hypothetical protein